MSRDVIAKYALQYWERKKLADSLRNEHDFLSTAMAEVEDIENEHLMAVMETLDNNEKIPQA